MAPPKEMPKVDKIKKGINKKHSHEITKDQVKAKLKSRRLAIPSGKFNRWFN